jgi:hypothetical protein
MTKVRLLTALSLGTMLFASCEKQLEESPTPRTASQSSTAPATLPGDWQLTAYKGIVPVPNSTNARVTDAFSMLDACKKDDKLHFAANGELTTLPGATLCDSDSKAKVGSWNLDADQKTLTLAQDRTEKYQIVDLTASTLKLRTVAAANEPYIELEYVR